MAALFSYSAAALPPELQCQCPYDSPTVTPGSSVAPCEQAEAHTVLTKESGEHYHGAPYRTTSSMHQQGWLLCGLPAKPMAGELVLWPGILPVHQEHCFIGDSHHHQQRHRCWDRLSLPTHSESVLVACYLCLCGSSPGCAQSLTLCAVQHCCCSTWTIFWASGTSGKLHPAVSFGPTLRRKNI